MTDKEQTQHEANLRAVMLVIGGDFCHGTTLRRWYIGQALAGAANTQQEAKRDAGNAIAVADAVLRLLAEEHLALDEERT